MDSKRGLENSAESTVTFQYNLFPLQRLTPDVATGAYWGPMLPFAIKAMALERLTLVIPMALLTNALMTHRRVTSSFKYSLLWVKQHSGFLWIHSPPSAHLLSV